MIGCGSGLARTKTSIGVFPISARAPPRPRAVIHDLRRPLRREQQQHYHLCVFEVKPGGGLVLTELHPGVTVDDIRAKTGAPFEGDLKTGKYCKRSGARHTRAAE
jgi:hypothetical protein